MSSNSARTLSPKEVATQLGLCTRTVLKLIRDERITPVYRLNARVIRIPQEAVDSYLANSKIAPPIATLPASGSIERRIAV